MEVGQGKFITHFRVVIVAQFQDFELANRVVDVARISWSLVRLRGEPRAPAIHTPS